MEINLFGELAVHAAGGPVAIRGAKERAVLTALAATPGTTIPSDVLITHLWPDHDADAAIRSLRVRISHLRRALEPAGAYVAFAAGGYRLDIDDDAIDVVRFRSLASAAGDAPPHSAVDLARQALALWTAEPFLEVRDLDLLNLERAELERLRRRTAIVLGEALIATGRASAAVPMLQGLVAEEPEAEDAVRALMLALAADGRRPEALAAYNELAGELGDRGLEPSPETRELEAAILLEEPIEAAPATKADGNLPVAPQPIGRDTDVARVLEALASERLVTVLGPAGAGKTRLVLETGRRALSDYPDGVWWIDLSPVRGDGAAELAVAHTLRIRSEPGRDLVATMADRLRRQRRLLVIDNCEHLVDDAGRVAAALLAHCPYLTVLATSRVPLGISAEFRYRLDPLIVPAVGADAEAAAAAPAVRLFLDTAARIRPGREWSDDDIVTVAAIARDLDGLPLAVELAATRLSSLSPHDIALRLDERLTLLRSDAADRSSHHASLEAAIGWSVELLDEDATKLFGVLSTFASSWSLDAAEALAGAGTDVLSALSTLVDHSLVELMEGPGGTRYRMLDSVRVFAATQLDATERRLVEGRHAAHYADLVDAAMAAPVSAGDLDRVASELAEIRRAFERTIETDPDRAAIIAGASFLYWYRRGTWQEGHTWLQRVLERGDPADPDVAVRVLNGAGFFTLFAGGDVAAAQKLYDRADAIAVATGEPRPFNAKSLVQSFQGHWDAAMDLLQQQIDQDHRLGSSAHIALANLAHLKCEIGEIAEARRLATAAQQEARRHGSELLSHGELVLIQVDLEAGLLEAAEARAEALLAAWDAAAINPDHRVGVMHFLAQAALRGDDRATAAGHLARANVLIRSTGRDVAAHLLVVAQLAAACEDVATAVRLAGAAEARLARGEALFPSRERTRQWALSLDVENGDALRSEGAALSAAGSLELAAAAVATAGNATVIHD